MGIATSPAAPRNDSSVVTLSRSERSEITKGESDSLPRRYESTAIDTIEEFWGMTLVPLDSFQIYVNNSFML